MGPRLGVFLHRLQLLCSIAGLSLCCICAPSNACLEIKAPQCKHAFTYIQLAGGNVDKDQKDSRHFSIVGPNPCWTAGQDDLSGASARIVGIRIPSASKYALM